MNLINIDNLKPNKKLTANENYVLEFINQKPDFFCNETILTIAQKTHVSPSTITRLTKKIGFRNLKQLQLHILYKKSLIKENYEIVDEIDLKSTLKNIKIYHLFSINETFNTLNLNQIQSLVEALSQSKRIMLYGVGSSFIVSNFLGLNLQKIGFDIVCNQDFHQILLSMPTLKENDHILLFSKTGETKEIKYLIQQGFKRKIPVSIVTSNTNLSSKNEIQNLVTFVSHKQKDRITSVSSKIAQFLVADIIFAETFKKCQKKEGIKFGVELTEEWNNK